LRSRLRGTPCSYFGPDLGVQTIGSSVRYPDALITCTKFPRTDRLAPDVRVVFEVLSPTSGRTDWIEKVREYAAVPSILRYIILETMSAGLLVLHRQHAKDDWTAAALTIEDTLSLPEIGIEIPVAEFYEDMDFTDTLVE
jgi:Uma2 family endonuclease